MRARWLWIDLALVAATALVYLQVLGFDFAKVDDTNYVTSNPHVLGGLTPANLAWAFRSFEASNWHPLTWVSLMLDATIAGRDPRVFHGTNLLLHVANTLLLAHVLAAMTGSRGRSAFVAAAFALHPLHVESVAWITERKDVLSTLFWFLTLAAYLRFVRRRTAASYALVLLAFAAGLLSKPMLVTLPFTLLLLDAWPLDRLGKQALREKLPLLVLSAASGWVTLAAQGSVVGGLEAVPLGLRLANGAVSYGVYALETVWPARLSIHYPFENPIPATKIGLALAWLGGMSWLAFHYRRSRPYLRTGWLWYVVTLLPVIGLVQVGEQSRADRYTYVPLVGLFLIAAWGAPELVRSKRALAAAAIGWLVALGFLAHRQTETWRNAFELFRHAVEVDASNTLARMGYAQELAARGQDQDAIEEYRRVLRLRPDAGFARLHLAEALARTGKGAQASEEYRQVLRLDPSHAVARLNLGILLMREGRLDEAASELREATRLRPQDAEPRATLGAVLTRRGELEAAIDSFEQALRLDPRSALAHKGIAVPLARSGRTEEAVAHLRTSLEIDPAQPDAKANLDKLLRPRNGTVQ